MSRRNVRRALGWLGTWKRRCAALVVVAAAVALCLALKRETGPGPAVAQQAVPQQPGFAAATDQPAPAQAAPQAPPSDVAATVNDVRITRIDLANQCLWHYGADVLDNVVNRALIADYCQAHNIVVTRQQIDDEMNKMAERFGVPRDEWLRMLETERNISPQQYANDILWPTIALRTIAAAQIQPTEKDIAEAYETLYGPAVQCRLIVCNDRPTIDKVRADALAGAEEFGDLAKKYSVDVNSASAKGLIQPIRKHMGDHALEQAAFQMQPGAISEVIQVGNQFVILKCENHLAARNMPMAQVQTVLAEAIRDKKLRLASNDVFAQIKAQSQVDKVFLDPQRRAAEPDVAARINGKVLEIRTLADECVARNGKEMLDGMISRTLLEQALQRAGLTVTREDLDAEIAQAALAMGKTTTPGGKVPDVQGWIDEVVKVQQIPYELYEYDTVWPSAALKKLVGATVQVTPEDLQKGYEANYGPRVKCRAIVFTQMRKAQEVWAMARDNPTVDNFATLAEQYSVDNVSRALRGEVPPIQRHGPQPKLEEEAFKLKPGELSGVIQMGDTWVILFCEAYTKPRDLPFAEVEGLIREEVFEKKLRLAMAQTFDKLHQAAHIDNYLTGTVQSPTLGKDPAQTTPGAAGGAIQTGFAAPAGAVR